MRERPILFNGAMVRAILAGAKTQTRRVATPRRSIEPMSDECPFGQVGDRLWVRETHSIFPTHGQHRADGERWGPWGGLPTTVSADGKQIAYYREGFDRCDPGRWRPSIHMPRWACRLVLEITAVRVQRLHDITVQDIAAEGIACYPDINPAHDFEELWNSTGGDWDSNPWVWVIEFKRVEA